MSGTRNQWQTLQNFVLIINTHEAVLLLYQYSFLTLFNSIPTHIMLVCYHLIINFISFSSLTIIVLIEGVFKPGIYFFGQRKISWIKIYTALRDWLLHFISSWERSLFERQLKCGKGDFCNQRGRALLLRIRL